MTRVINQVEALPESYPAVSGVTGTALATAWQRIEHYIAWRYSPRVVAWRVEGDECEWLPPLAPVVTLVAQQGTDPEYTPEAGPMGGYMLASGHTLLTATVGAGPVPDAVTEAVRRYAAFVASIAQVPPGASRFSSGTFSASFRREDMAPGAALINCGAADLLRPYRRVGCA